MSEDEARFRTPGERYVGVFAAVGFEQAAGFDFEHDCAVAAGPERFFFSVVVRETGLADDAVLEVDFIKCRGRYEQPLLHS